MPGSPRTSTPSSYEGDHPFKSNDEFAVLPLGTATMYLVGLRHVGLLRRASFLHANPAIALWLGVLLWAFYFRGMAVLILRGTAVLTLRLLATQLLSNFNPSERSLTEGTVPSTGRPSLVARSSTEGTVPSTGRPSLVVRSLTQGTVPRNGLYLSRYPLGRRRRFLRCVVSEHAAHGGNDAHVLF